MEKIEACDKNSVISKLIQGRDHANELKKQLINNIPKSECDFLMEKIIGSYDNALAVLNCMALLGNGDYSSSHEVSTISSDHGSPKSEGSDPYSKTQARKHVSKKRKTSQRWREKVHVCSGTGVDGPMDDGYNWRKYGQKGIFRAKHPRSYYRCTYRNTQGCMANKQVQRLDDDASIMEVTYIGKHSCIQDTLKQNKENFDTQMEVQNIEEDSKSGLKVEIQGLDSNEEWLEPNKENIDTHNEVRKKDRDSESGLKVEIQALDSNEDSFPSFSFPSTPIQYETEAEAPLFSDPANITGTSYSPRFLTPETSESHFSISPCQVKEFVIGQGSELDFAETISNPTPVMMNFPLEDMDFDTSFFNSPDHFYSSHM